jgi:hypothetical protein
MFPSLIVARPSRAGCTLRLFARSSAVVQPDVHARKDFADARAGLLRLHEFRTGIYYALDWQSQEPSLESFTDPRIDLQNSLGRANINDDSVN